MTKTHLQCRCRSGEATVLGIEEGLNEEERSAPL